MDILIGIYFAINIFAAGDYFGSEYGWSKSNLRVFLVSLFFIFFWLPFYAACFLYDTLVRAINYINTVFQVQFWFYFLFTKEYSNLTQDQLYRINELASKRNTSSIAHKIYRSSVLSINKRHNYTYIPNSV